MSYNLDMNFDSLKDISIVIPSYERPEYLERSLNYWNEFYIKVIVLDGSSEPLNRNFLSGLNSQIEYHHLPVSFEERLQIGMNLVTTNYVAMLGDDEYFLIQGLLACKDELEKNNKLVSCTGICWEFYTQNESIVMNERYVNWLEFCSISDEDPIARIHTYSRNSMSAICYSLVRSSSWRKATNVIVTNPNGVTFLTEIFIELSVAFEGNTKVIDVPFWLRSAEIISHWENNSTVSIEKWLHDPKYKDQRQQYLNTFAEVLGGNSTSNSILKSEVFKALKLLSFRVSGVQNSSLSRFPILAGIISRLFYSIPAHAQRQRVFIRWIGHGKKLIKSHATSDYRGLKKGERLVLDMQNELPIEEIFGQAVDSSFKSFKKSVENFYGY